MNMTKIETGITIGIKVVLTLMVVAAAMVSLLGVFLAPSAIDAIWQDGNSDE